MKIKFKKLVPTAVTPAYAVQGDAGLDLHAVSKSEDGDGNIVYGTGIAIQLPPKYVALVFPRSSNATKHLVLSNSVGMVDSGYRGEITVKFKKTYNTEIGGSLRHRDYTDYAVGDKVAQLLILPYPLIEMEEVNELNDTERGKGSYGHTGR